MNKYNNFHIRPQSVNRLRSIPLITDRHVSSQNRSYTPSKDHILSTPIQINQTTRNNPNLSLGTPHQSKSDISLNYPASHYNSNISLLTLQANEQLKIKERRVCLPPADLYRSSSQINSKRMPGPHEFSKILDKLEKVATNQMGSLRKPALKEAKSVLILMEQGESQYFKIKVKGKNCPLRVNIKKNRGNYRVYASKTVPEPNETLNDYIFKTDYLNIGDIGLNFKFDCIYLGILAIENSSLEISVFFGKLGQEIDQNDRLSKSPASNIFRDNRSKSSRKLEELMRNDTLREKLRRKAEEILNQRKAQAILLSGHKDFLKLNMALNTPTSPTGQRPSSTTREKREQRRTEVKVRKEHIFSERKIRLITLNHRHEARKLEIEEEMKAKKLKKSIDKCYIYWIRIIYFSKGYTSIVQNLKTTREEIIRKIYRIAMARKMQRFCRKAMSQITIQKLKFLRARNCLLFYYSNYRPIVTMTDSVRIFKFIRDSAKNYVIPKQFTGLQHKSNL